MRDLFQYSDYREFMRAKTEELHEIKGLINKMAEAAHCQRSHISRVLNSHLHLTMDQAHGLTLFWKLNENEATYFLKLVELARSGDRQYRARLEREIAKLKQDHENLGKRLNLPSLGIAEAELFYYSNWYWSAIHIATSIPELQTAASIATRLQLSEILVSECLQVLERYRLVAHEGERWLFTSNTIHLSKESPMNSIQHGNWRARAVQNSQVSQADGVHYTIVQSLSRKDFQNVKDLVLKTIVEYQKIAAPSKEEELVCFAADFFRV